MICKHLQITTMVLGSVKVQRLQLFKSTYSRRKTKTVLIVLNDRDPIMNVMF